MKTPICEVCAKTGELCQNCVSGIRKGRITQLDAKISSLLYQINEKHNITNASFVKSVELDGLVIIFTDTDPGLLIGRGGKVVAELTAATGKKVRIAKYNNDIKRALEDLTYPVCLLGINRVYSQGKEIMKLRLPKNTQNGLPIALPLLQKAAARLLNSEVSIVFE